MKKKNSVGKIGLITVILGVSGFIFLIYLNSIQPVQLLQESVPTATGTQTVYVKTCQSIPNALNNTLCTLSNNVQTPNSTTTVTSTTASLTSPIAITSCPNNGVPINGVCPTTVTPIAALPANVTTTVTPPPPANSVTAQIIPNISSIDDSGNVNTLTANPASFTLQSFLRPSPGLSFIALTNGNTPVDKGFIVLGLSVKTVPNDNVTASGILWVSVNGVQLHPNGVPFSAVGITGPNSLLNANIQMVAGAFSQNYTFNVAQRSALLTTQPIIQNFLNFSMSNISIKNGAGKSYTSPNRVNLANIELDYNQYQIITKSASGSYVPILPSDDTFSLSSISRSYEGFTACTNPKCGGGTSYYVYTAPPAIGSGTVYQLNSDGTKTILGNLNGFSSGSAGGCANVSYGCVVTNISATGGGTQTISNIPRNANIQVVINAPNALSKTFMTGLSNENHSWVCNDQGCTFS